MQAGPANLKPRAVWTTRAPGTYLLLLRLARPVTLDVGRLGRIAFRPGWYVYVGSALGGLGPRLRRHARPVKRHHWHIDALRGATSLGAVVTRWGSERLECAVADRVSAWYGASRPVRRFGSSDCRCAGHLIYFDRRPDLDLDDAWTVTTLAAGRADIASLGTGATR